mmetsp:Transcript_60000/g.167411  ORF Transcript_60000/g.167411 Transcript_60000/m.167411 type:complete len:140 (-) Transcript_60000:671-1090(-)
MGGVKAFDASSPFRHGPVLAAAALVRVLKADATVGVAAEALARCRCLDGSSCADARVAQGGSDGHQRPSASVTVQRCHVPAMTARTIVAFANSEVAAHTPTEESAASGRTSNKAEAVRRSEAGHVGGPLDTLKEPSLPT